MKSNVYIKNKEGKEFPILRDKPFMIGSFEGVCDLVLKDIDVSPIHAQIRKEDTGYIIEEQRTNTGLYVNDTKIVAGNSLDLKDKDEIRIGEEVFIFTESNELLSASESEKINTLYKELLNSSSDEETKRLSSDLISIFKEKLDLISSISGQEIQIGKQEQKSSNAQAAGPVNAKAPIKEQNRSESKKELNSRKIAASGMNSFGNRRRSIDISNEKTVGIESQLRSRSKRNVNNRRVNIPSGNRRVSHPILEEEQGPKELLLKEIRYPYASIRIESTPFKIGRSDDHADFVLDRKGISRHHATIIMNDMNNGFLIQDNNATNGTFVNEQRVIGGELPIKKGDVIRLYECEFRVVKIN